MGKRVITEADVLKMTAPGELVVDENSLLTPAAYDTACLKGLKVIFRRRSASSSKEKGGFEKKIPDLKNGDYLLQIREGQARIFRIEDNGVVPYAGGDLPKDP